ncbi:RloB family protein [Porphyromonas gingivalis]|uniref:RloB family protein n=1 Tax=Porphyromonas gingivalis TaxID=837 RepID=UPI00211BD6A7|nr:RloB family protein [Porphyromonas gingivalis]
MGQPPKREIERLKREKREAKAAKKRKKNTRDIIVRFLIVCEGQKTEPNYFKALIGNHYSEVRDVEAEIRGQGCSTCALVERAKEIRDDLEKERELGFDRIWVVFDKDDFDDFNRAIDLAKSYGFGCAWTNEAFELWFLLHFQYLDVPISRDAYISKLEKLIQKRLNDNFFRYD